jgi:hypothetical protein
MKLLLRPILDKPHYNQRGNVNDVSRERRFAVALQFTQRANFVALTIYSTRDSEAVKCGKLVMPPRSFFASGN